MAGVRVENKFKVGDKVRLINMAFENALEFSVGEVSNNSSNFYPMFYRVKFSNNKDLFIPSINLELIEESVPNVGVKHDNGKPDLSMIPFEALEEIAKVLQFGASKYTRSNWKKGISTTRLSAAALRHLGKWCDGVDLDNESNLNHIAHSACNLLMLLWTLKHKPELDDRTDTEEGPENDCQ